ncbi:ABC transporter substrate-binding protein [Roseisolibacter agri]|uniref:Cobalamin-binding protein n=1 Tax=Roseisolibacter agri TaxID=2014610 RepID=A0AA37QIQ2_9BACT|nr:helical backbone metal receptor [Roseisolibacter agri]GLC26543.1 cobalamin-binding protein [Roseisolibacter agri]
MHPSHPFLARALVAASLLAACDRAATPRAAGDTAMAVAATAVAATAADSIVRDDYGDTVRVGARPRRIVSLNPATTEILFAIGAGDRLVGRSRWDGWPAEAQRVPAVGDGIRPNLEATLAARPDLVLLYAGAENRDAARALRAAGIATAAIKVDRLDDFRRATRLLGRLTGDTARARTVVDSVDATLERVRRVVAGRPRPRVVWPMFGRPLLAVGGGSFQHEVLTIAGGDNVFGDDPKPAVQVSREEVLRRGADAMLVGPTRDAEVRADPAWRSLAAVRDGRVLVVDTAVVYRPAVRLGEAAVNLARLLHPEVADSLAPVGAAPRP